MNVSIEDRTEIYKRFAAGEKPGQIQRAFPHLTAMGIGRMLKKSGIGRGTGIVPPQLITSEGAMVRAAEVPISQVSTDKLVEFQQSSQVQAGLPQVVPQPCALFPSAKQNAVAAIQISRTLANPSTAGVGLLPDLDPFANEDVIRRTYGGGRYLLVAKNSKGEVLNQKAIDILGRSLPVEQSEADDLDGSPVMVASQGDPAVAMLIRSMNEENRRQREQDQLRLEAMFQRMKEDADQRVGFILELSKSKESNQQMVYQTLLQQTQEANSRSLAQTQEHQKALAEVYTRNQPKERDILDDLERIKKIKEVFLEDAQPESAFDKALGALPGIAAVFMGGGGDDEEDEPEEAPKAPPAPRQAAPAGAPASRAPSPQEAAETMFRMLVSQGMSPEKAKERIKTGMQFLAADLPKKKPVVVKSPLVAAAETKAPIIDVESKPVAPAVPEPQGIGEGKPSNGIPGREAAPEEVPAAAVQA